jgi:YidC/Oxa1 family membrane protein insertase
MSKHSNKFATRAAILVGGAVAVLGLASCTKSFCTNQDKANQIFAAYGNIFSDSVDQTEKDDTIPSAEEGNKLSEYALTTRNTNREALFNKITSAGYTLPTVTFQNFITEKAQAEADRTFVKWTDNTIDNLTESEAKKVAFHVALYAGLDENNQVSNVWTNFDTWYAEAVADPTIGVLKAPGANYVTLMKNTVNQAIAQNFSCITPTNMTLVQGGSEIYVQGKTWGQAFKQFGFLEGLFVYPFAWLVHAISEGLNNTAAAQLLAILVVTLLVRLVTVISTVFQSKTQAKQVALQPQIAELQKKYPGSQTDPDQRRALAMEQARLMKKNKVHPMLPLLFMILQFPLFICIWSALQGSAALANGSFLGLSLTTRVSTTITAFKTTPGAIVGVIIFILMSVANILSSCTGLWFNTWRTKKFGQNGPVQYDAQGNPIDPNKTMKYMTYGMMVFVIFMGWSLPAAMGIYWFIGAVISIAQSLFTELLQMRSRHKLAANTGDGTTLAAIRRSKHHSATNTKKDKKSKSDKPLWR